MKRIERLTIMAGGTGGHVFPGLAIAEALQARGVEVTWLGTAGGMERRWVEEASLPFEAIDITGLRGKGVTGWLKAPLNVSRAVTQARRILRRQRPQAVLGMGGFVCGPGGLAARSLGVPLFLHEQNAIGGLTNRLLAPLSEAVYAGFPFVGKPVAKAEVFGNPVRAEIEAVPSWRAHDGPPRLLVLGGSRGALALNRTVPAALALLDRPVEVRHQSGQLTYDEARAAYEAAGVTAKVTPFIDDVAAAYAWADLIVCRAGALTVTEVMAAGRAALFVPFPHAVDDHQRANAALPEQAGAAEVIVQEALTPQRLAASLDHWLEPARLAEAGAIMRRLYRPQAAARIVDDMLERLQEA